MKKLRSILQLRGGADEKDKSRLGGLLAEAVSEQADGIRKSMSDTRQYRLITLPNQLEALLVSDPKTEKAAAALSVNVGSYSDPPELPGLAHFLEHMLFMGTEKYPQENEYSSFLSENGGYSNAYTASELTNYQFEVISGKLDDALDRFAQFFIKPLLLEGALDREVKAVDNECSGNQQNDAWRRYLIYREIAHEHHPIHKFNIGNIETLKHEPERQNINTRERLLNFYNKHYSANLMKLVVIGKETLDELEDMVKEKFSAVPNHDFPSPYVHPEPAGPAFDEKNLQKFINVVPVMDVRRIEIYWVLPKLTTENKLREAIGYLGSLFGDEGEGSILSHLKKEGWANGLSCGATDDNYDLATFGVMIECTNEGITNHVNDIIEVVYNYINMLHGAFEDKEGVAYFFEQEKIMSAIRYWFKSDTNPFYLCMSLADQLQGDYPSKDVLINRHLSLRDSFEEVKQILSLLVPSNMLCFISSQKFESNEFKEEEFFKTKYVVSDVSDDFAATLVKASDFEKLGLKVTAKNTFIPSQFNVAPFDKPTIVNLAEGSSEFLAKVATVDTVSSYKALQHAGIPDKVAVFTDTVQRNLLEVWEDDTFRRPIVIHSDVNSTVWLKQDTTHKKPKSVVKVYLKTPIVNESIFAKFSTRLYVDVVNDILNEETYAASSAGFSHRISSNNNGIVLTFNGFAETLYKYVGLVTNKLKTYSKEDLDSAIFGRFKEKLIKDISNIEKARPVGLAVTVMYHAFEEKSESIQTKLNIAKEITIKQVQEFASTIFEDIAIETLACGNATTKDALQINEILQNVFSPKKAVSEHHFERTTDISGDGPQQFFHIQPAFDPQNPGSGIVVSLQFGERTDTNQALMSILGDVLGEQFFNDLRTKQTLGYIVQASPGMINGILMLNFYVESNSTNPIELNYKIERFIDQFKQNFDTLFSEGKFKDIVNAAISGILERSNNINSETAVWWQAISSGLYTFENGYRVADALTKVTKEDLRSFLDQYLWGDAPKRAKFVSGIVAEVHGNKTFGETYADQKPQRLRTQRQGFSKDYINKWLKKDEENTKNLVHTRGQLHVISDLEDFRKNRKLHSSYKAILAKL